MTAVNVPRLLLLLYIYANKCILTNILLYLESLKHLIKQIIESENVNV